MLNFLIVAHTTFLLVQVSVETTIGFIKEAPGFSICGYNVYHKNRLIRVPHLCNGLCIFYIIFFLNCFNFVPHLLCWNRVLIKLVVLVIGNLPLRNSFLNSSKLYPYQIMPIQIMNVSVSYSGRQ